MSAPYGMKPISVVTGLTIPEHDLISLSYTGTDLTGVEYKLGGVTIATLVLVYNAGVLQSVTKS